MFPLNALSIIEFTGLDAGQFLHNQLSADVAAIPTGGAGFACCCNPAGRVLGLLLIAVRKEAIFAVCASDLAAPLIEWLSRFIIRADVKIELRSDLVVSAGLPEVSPARGWPIDTEAGLQYGIVPAVVNEPEGASEQLRAWRARELQAGITWLGTGTSAQFLPQMLGFEAIGALSFKKGCYPGQEIIARTRYLGNLKRRPLLLHIAASVPVGIMEKINVKSGDEHYSAVVVDSVTGAERDQYLFSVVRAGEDILADRVTIREQSYEVIRS